MEVIEICPKCNGLGVKVELSTVRNLVLEKYKKLVENNVNWCICSDKKCDVIYFSPNSIYTKSDVKVKVWFKELSSEEVPICYCSNITNFEIMEAVKNGCKSIMDVQNYTKKNITGKCRYKNPLGRCCRDVFLSTLNKSEKDNASNNDYCCSDK